MRACGTHRPLSIALAFALTFTLACALAPAEAAPSTSASASTPEIDAKEAEQLAALDELGRLQARLASEVSEYVSLGWDLDRTRVEISEVETRIVELDAQVVRLEEALDDRAVAIYRGGGLDMLDVMLGSRSLQDFFLRTHYLVLISERDARLVTEIRTSRAESLWLEQHLAGRIARLEEMQAQADDRRSRIESDLAAQQAEALAIGADLATLLRERELRLAFTGGEPSGAFDPDTVITDANFRDSASLTADEIQAFLDQQPGTLKSYRAKDHNGQVRSVAEMIAEASTAWGVSPQVILVTLQKEQSLLAKKNPSREAYDWAMGCGKADSRTYYEYQGFGNQIWWGAQKLDKNARLWEPGAQLRVDGSIVRPTNAATHGLYRYTPHFRGTMSFWMLYWRYFGDPLS